MKLSKNKIDRAGAYLSKFPDAKENESDFLEMESVFDEYRKRHLQPLSETTMEIQRLMDGFGKEYSIAQRLKRKPQIIRKLKRLTTRLSQLQDIAGCRVVLHKNNDVDSLIAYFKEVSAKQKKFKILKITDYREKGRDDTGYRACHICLERENVTIELQIRSKIQHYWAESIERTSVIYGYHLKEKEGASELIDYFKHLSDIFYEVESGRDVSVPQKIKMNRLKQESERIITDSDKYKIFDSYVNEDIIKTLIEKEKFGKGRLNNWILVFNWNEGSFVSWDIVSNDPDEAVKKYTEYEKLFRAEHGFEVVLIGSSNVATIRDTHSHYFGIESQESILASLDNSISVFFRKMDIDVGARQILATLYRRNFWGRKGIKIDTIKNHFCKGVLTIESSIKTLTDKNLIVLNNGAYSLNLQKKSEIEQYLH